MLMKHFVLIFFLALSSAVHALTYKSPRYDISGIIAAAVRLDVCMGNPAYKKLPKDKALKIEGLSLRLSNLVEKIEKYHKRKFPQDKNSYSINFELRGITSIGMIDHVKTKYNYCGDNLLIEMEAYVLKEEKEFDKLLSK